MSRRERGHRALSCALPQVGEDTGSLKSEATGPQCVSCPGLSKKIQSSHPIDTPVWLCADATSNVSPHAPDPCVARLLQHFVEFWATSRASRWPASFQALFSGARAPACARWWAREHGCRPIGLVSHPLHCLGRIKLTWLVLGGDLAARSHRVEQLTAL